jgi:hypothetical protein
MGRPKRFCDQCARRYKAFTQMKVALSSGRFGRSGQDDPACSHDRVFGRFDSSVGRYRGAVTLANGRRRTVSGKTRKEASAKLIDLQAKLADGFRSVRPTGSARSASGG